MSKLNLFKCHGGKHYLAKWIISHFPVGYQQMIYLEPFLGGGNVLLQKEPSSKEAANDIDIAVYCLWTELKCKRLFRATNLSWSENIFNFYKSRTPVSNWEIAEREYVLRNMSRGGLKKDFSKSGRLRGNQPEGKNAWENKLKMLPKIWDRIKNVEFYNKDAIEFLKFYNNANAFAYLDPPYVPYTRTARNVYDYELNSDKHIDLVRYLKFEWKGLYLLSGYSSSLYDNEIGPPTITKPVSNNSGQNKTKGLRWERLWKNY